MFLGDFLDVHAALGAGHDERTRIRAIQQHGEIKFFFYFCTGGEQQCLHHAAFRAGLLRDQHLPSIFSAKPTASSTDDATFTPP